MQVILKKEKKKKKENHKGIGAMLAILDKPKRILNNRKTNL